MPNRVTISTLIIELICPFTQVARGQQSDPVQPPPATMLEGPQRNTGGVSASDVATANNPIAPMNALFFQNYYAPTVYGKPGPNNFARPAHAYGQWEANCLRDATNLKQW